MSQQDCWWRETSRGLAEVYASQNERTSIDTSEEIKASLASVSGVDASPLVPVPRYLKIPKSNAQAQAESRGSAAIRIREPFHPGKIDLGFFQRRVSSRHGKTENASVVEWSRDRQRQVLAGSKDLLGQLGVLYSETFDPK